MTKKFEIKWNDLTKEAKNEYLFFFSIKEPMFDKEGNLVLEREVK